VKAILGQLARSGLLWDDAMVAAIFAGKAPPLEEIALSLVISCMDAEITVRNDPQSSWNHRRIARACLISSFLSAIACLKEEETES
jgi:hypothetical protein